MLQYTWTATSTTNPSVKCTATSTTVEVYFTCLSPSTTYTVQVTGTLPGGGTVTAPETLTIKTPATGCAAASLLSTCCLLHRTLC